MKRRMLAACLATVFILAGAHSGMAWQGRMAGMGDPYGLVADESDYLIHPAKLADGQGVRFYGGYRFTWNDVENWKWRNAISGPIASSFLPPIGILNAATGARLGGDEYYHDATLGMAFPVAGARMAFFFDYRGKVADYGGNSYLSAGVGPLSASAAVRGDADSDFSKFGGRFLYAVPLSGALQGMNFGAEFDIGHTDEKNSTTSTLQNLNLIGFSLPVSLVSHGDTLGLYRPLLLPYDSDYYEAVMKVGLSGAVGKSDVGFTLRGGPLFGGGTNYGASDLLGVPAFGLGVQNRFDLDGDVSGYTIGTDLWARIPLSESLAIPLSLKADYTSKGREANGTGNFTVFLPTPLLSTTTQYGYESHEWTTFVEVGGGLEKTFDKNRVAGGLYYQFVRNESDFFMSATPFGTTTTFSYDSDIPIHNEHRLLLRGVAETKAISDLTMRAGLELFYGWVREQMSIQPRINTFAQPLLTSNTDLKGNQFGLNGSVGVGTKIWNIEVEPFLFGGYRALDIDGPGYAVINVPGGGGGTVTVPFTGDKYKNEWVLGVGFSVALGS